MKIGSLRLTSFFKQSVGYTSNKQSAALGTAGAFSLSELNLQLRSQWARHELAVNAVGTYRDYFDRYIEPSPTVDIDASLRLDLVDGFVGTIGTSYSFQKEAATSTSLTQAVINEPGLHNFGAFARIQRTGQRFDFSLRTSISRTLYEDAKLSGGGILSQADRDLMTYGIEGRVTYQTGLAISPFVRASYSFNDYDWGVDRNGQNRDSAAYELRGGITANIGEKLNGEISAGFVNQQYVDPALASLAGLVVNASLDWSPQRDTNITLTLGSSLGGSTTAGDGGAITHQGAFALRKRMRDNLEVNGGLSVTYTNSEGLGRIDTTYAATSGFEYWFSRTLSMTGQMTYTNLDSSSTPNSYDATEFVLGLKIQH